MDEPHVIPSGDEIRHEVGVDCVCLPTCLRGVCPDGAVVRVWLHNALDGGFHDGN